MEQAETQQSQIQTQPNTQPPPRFNPLKFNRNILIGLIASILVAIAIFASYFVSGSSQTKTAISKPKVTSSPTPDPTANWKTYSGSSFTFKYPESWNVQEENDNVYFGDSQIVNARNSKMLITILDGNLEEAKRLWEFGDVGLLNKTEQINSEVMDGVEITKAVVSFSQYDHDLNKYVEESRSYQVLVPLSNTTTLRFYTKISEKNILDQILSTFRFD